jgi:hypothetical protein
MDGGESLGSERLPGVKNKIDLRRHRALSILSGFLTLLRIKKLCQFIKAGQSMVLTVSVQFFPHDTHFTASKTPVFIELIQGTFGV